jgi:mRNA-degrading endonuclease toxin of MazEF toxin-antitoxin module
MKYKDLKNLESNNKITLKSMFGGILENIKNISFKKTTTLIKDFPTVCELSYNSYENTEKRKQSCTNMHPVIPTRGEIYNAFITEGVGKELSGNHLVIVVQNERSNIYSDKVTIVPIEGDGNIIKTAYQVKLTNSDLSYGKIDKDPSRIIYADIISVDKARLGRKIGELSQEKMERLDILLKKHLSL